MFEIRIVFDDCTYIKKLQVDSEAFARDIYLGVTLALCVSTHSQWRVELLKDGQILCDDDDSDSDFSAWTKES